MNKNRKLIILSVLLVLIVIVISISVTTAFMKPIENGGNLTSVSLSSCAKITLEGTNSINLTNSYPMSKNKALQTTPYSFKVTSSCDSYVGFNLYIATLTSNTLDASNIHYIITYKDSKDILSEGTLTSSLVVTDFSDAEITELNTGLGSSYGSIYKVFNNPLPLKGSKEYNLYLYIDESVTSASGTFVAGVAIKSYDREKSPTLAEWVINEYNSQTAGNETIYYHDSNLENGAGDNSYRYSGGNYKLTAKATNEGFTKIESTDSTSTDALINYYCIEGKKYVGAYCDYPDAPSYYTLQYDTNNTQYNSYGEAAEQALNDGYIEGIVNNYICFGSDSINCPNDNLYRIIGVFDNRVRLIKADYATVEILGTDTNDYYDTYYNSVNYFPEYKGSLDISTIPVYYWNYENSKLAETETGYPNDWGYSLLNKTHLNNNYINYLNDKDTKWTNMIDITEWNVGGNTIEYIAISNAQTAYTNEITNPSDEVTSTYSSKIGLMYVSDYYYGASPTYWTYQGYDANGGTVNDKWSGNDYSQATMLNWMYMGLFEWTMSRSVGNCYAFIIHRIGYINFNSVQYLRYAVRPVFHLKSTVEVTDGDGTLNNPYRIEAG